MGTSKEHVTANITFYIVMSLNLVFLVYRLALCLLCSMFPYLALFSHASSFINRLLDNVIAFSDQVSTHGNHCFLFIAVASPI